MHVGYSTQGRKDLRTWRLTLGVLHNLEGSLKRAGYCPLEHGKRAEPSTKEITAIQLLPKDLLNTDFSAHLRQVIQTLGSVQEKEQEQQRQWNQQKQQQTLRGNLIPSILKVKYLKCQILNIASRRHIRNLRSSEKYFRSSEVTEQGPTWDAGILYLLKSLDKQVCMENSRKSPVRS